MKVIVLHHVHRAGQDQEDVKLIGVYSSYEQARAAQSRVSALPGFSDTADGFQFDEYEVDTDQWAEGYTSFIAWIGPQELHGATILRLMQGNNATKVFSQDHEGRPFALEFLEVVSVHATRPEGMSVYGLAEMEAKSPLRRFVFVDWDEGSGRKLEIVARDFRNLTLTG
ncbi:MAG: hypothetical protein JXB07_17465 [Anaerolineae bacterium]|nr:hypothetical protein [Anaerolineae bacterium]